MPSTIKLKSGSGAPTSGQLVTAEPAFDLTNKRLYTEDSGGTVIEVGSNPTSLTTPTINNSTGVSLQYNGSTKAATTSTGIDVTGTVVADGLTVDGNATLSSAEPRLIIAETDATDLNTRIRNTTGKLQIQTLADDLAVATNRLQIDHATGDISFYEDTGTTAKFFWDASAESLGIGTTSPNIAGFNSCLTIDGADSGLELSSGGTVYATLAANAQGANLQGVGTSGIRMFTAASGSATERMRIDSSGNVGIGTSSPATKLQVDGIVSSIGANAIFAVRETGTYGLSGITSPDYGIAGGVLTGRPNPALTVSGYDAIAFGTNRTERMRIDSSGNVGIGTSSPAYTLDINKPTVPAVDTYASLHIQSDTYGYILEGGVKQGVGTQLIFKSNNAGAVTERMRLDTSGNLLVGKTAANTFNSTAGHEQQSNGLYANTRDGGIVQILNRLTSDGDIAVFRKDGTTVGSIGTAPSRFYLNTQGRDGELRKDGTAIVGWDAASLYSATDATANLGLSNYRFKDLYLSGGVITGGGGTGNSGKISFVADSERATITGGYNTGGGGYLAFNTDTTGGSNLERMRIDSSGNLLVGVSSTTDVPYGGYGVFPASGQLYLATGHNTSATSGSYYHACYYNGSLIGGITQSGTTGVAYNTSSDYRLKENVVPMDNASDRVLALKPCRFNFIADPDKTVDGFLAHEAQEVVPEAVHGTKDAMRTEKYEVSPAVLDDEGNVVTEAVMGTREVPDYQGIDQSKLVPLLTKALQEALERIAALEAKVG